MITVAGFNTAIDRSIHLHALVPGTVARATGTESRFGGKGLHVAQTIAALGESVRLVGLTDRFHHDQMVKHLHERGVQFHGVQMDGTLRCNLAFREHDGRSSEILDPGAPVPASIRQQLLSTLLSHVDESACVVLSGSLPCGFADDTYAQLVGQIDRPCLVDASAATLLAVAHSGAHLLKPNLDEAGALAGHAVTTINDAAALARQLHARGIARPMITLGAQGAIAFDGNSLWHASIAIESAGDAVGSGDCFLGGVAVVMARGGDLVDALRAGVACGAANTLHDEAGYLERSVVDQLCAQVRIKKLDG